MFLYSGGTSDFLKFKVWLWNSVHTTWGHGRSEGDVGGGWGSAMWNTRPCQGYLETGCGILDASVGELTDSIASPISEAFSFGDIHHD